MKKYLFCAGVLALAVSCTENELDSFSAQNEAAKGIVFTAEISEAPTTKSDLKYDDASGVHEFFWYAEQDRINIWSTNTKVTAPGGSANGNGGTSFDVDKKAIYKATKSMVNGDFTAIDDDNWLEFNTDSKTDWTNSANDSKKSEFFATYPKEVVAEEFNGTKADGYTVLLSGLPAINEQNTDELNGKAVTEIMPMFSYSVAYPEASYDAVGEKVGLEFVRPFAGALFTTKGVTEYSQKQEGQSQSLFGKLKKITLEAKGYDADNDGVTTGTNDIKPSVLAYNAWKETDNENGVKYLLNTKDITKSKFVKNDGADVDGTTYLGSSKITLTFNSGSGLEWSDENSAYMAMNYINRAAAKFTDEKKETMEATFEFERIKFVVKWQTANNWPSVQGNNMFSGMKVLDMANYPFLVTEESGAGANDRALIVNSGAFSNAFNQENDVIWNGEAIDMTEFNTIISKVELTPAELEMLDGFTNLVSIQLDKNTDIPAGTFEGLTEITSINMPMVDVIEDGAFESSVELATVILPAYKFEKKSVNEVLLKADYLVTLDMSGVETMKNVFPAEGFSLNDFGELASVKVGENLVVGSAGFANCTSLKTIEGGPVDISEGPGAFQGSGITKINLTNGIIPANAFKDCEELTTVYASDGKTLLAPTKVGNAAFSGCSKLVNMDLSEVKGEESVIGEEAFKNCAKFVGMPDEDRGINVLYVGAETIKREAFAGCAKLEYVEFTNAKVIEEDILVSITTLQSNTVKLKELKFKQVVDCVDGKAASTMFGTIDATKLFLNPEQGLAYYEGNTFYPEGNKNVDGAKGCEFSSITFE